MDSIETERLILRPFAERDAEAMLAVLGDEEVNRFLPMFTLKSVAEVEAFIRSRHEDIAAGRTLRFYAVCLKADGVPAGYVHVSGGDNRDLGYALRRDLWHGGICTEACRAVVVELRRMGLPYVTATHDVYNPRSGGVMRALGMKYRYSYEELWQPKNITVTFRMYQLDLDGREHEAYDGYRKRYPVSFVEDI